MALWRVLVGVATASSVGANNLRAAPAVSKDVVQEQVTKILADAEAGYVSDDVAEVSSELRPFFDAMPKVGKEDRLSHTTVRFVLHRYFMQKYSWFVRGLEPGDSAPATLGDVNFTLGSSPVWPAFLQGELERSAGGEKRGLDLVQVAGLALALEGLVHYETLNRLTMAYDGMNRSTDSPVEDEWEFHRVLKEYTLLYTSGWNMTEMSHEELEMEERKHYGSNRWRHKFVPWIQQLRHKIVAQREMSEEQVPFSDVAIVAEEIDRTFYEVNNADCKSMKYALLEMENRIPGRVRLSDFYNRSRVTKWAFTEKVDYLRTLGALDESNASNPLVITTNYITSMPQCLQASSLYSICCPNECETILSALERELAAPEADPDVIAELVSRIGTETVPENRQLSATLMQRLREIAALHGGRIPLHGRLFAQWLHHAYPRECPFPHEATSTSPLTPDEWMKETGNSDSQASEEEMLKHIIPDDSCPAEGCPKAGEDEDGLPWNPLEELLHSTNAYGSGIVSGESEMKMLLDEVDESLDADISGGGLGVSLRTVFSATTLCGLLAAGLAAMRFYTRCSDDKALKKMLHGGGVDAYV
eukprot:TRINITY_DN121328_c0_g1_i1.p1 TRINITY_DN121328_c0_g1~~TRINITY_DN121328_c0_g1_i1.p1  ORF type:complete len:589 (-),score=133.24 TRINITY_DN121328_c0_g1_i1:157-1923(-)